jgi:hypothetical protein
VTLKKVFWAKTVLLWIRGSTITEQCMLRKFKPLGIVRGWGGEADTVIDL